MDYSTLNPQELIDALQTGGQQPDHALLKTIIERKTQVQSKLITRLQKLISLDLNSLSIDDPKRYEGILVGRLCIELKLMGALPVLGELLRQTWGEGVTIDGLERDFAHFGPDAIPVFEAIVGMNTLNKWHNGKSVAITALTDIGLMFPNAAGAAKSALRSGLPKLNAKGGISAPRDEMWGDLGIALAKLQDQDSNKQILAMIRQGVTDPGVITRDRYDRFYSGKQAPRVPEPFDIMKKYAFNLAFEQMISNLGEIPDQEAPDHAHDRVTQAKQAEARRMAAKNAPGRNDPCPCGSGKKYKNCCGKK